MAVIILVDNSGNCLVNDAIEALSYDDSTPTGLSYTHFDQIPINEQLDTSLQFEEI